MRTLNRPMFNMGGPIKQGIMHGIREPYKGGGKAALVGNPVYPKTDGREHHFAVSGTIATAAALNAARIAAMRAAPSIFRSVGNIFRGTGAGQVTGGGGLRTASEYARTQMAPLSKLEKIKSWFGSAPAGKYLAASPEASLITGGAGWAGKAGRGIYGAGKWLAKSPLTVGGLIYAGGKWYTKDGKEVDPPTPGTGVPGGGDPGMTYTAPGKEVKVLSDDERKAFANKQRSERVQKYMDMMGYDRSKKTAIADALIDASKIVSDRGTLDKKNITQELINPIIQATSKRLDKPEQIREAVGLMATKAEIEKDLSKETDALKTKLTKLQIKGAENTLAESASFEGALGKFLSDRKGAVDKATLERISRLFADAHGETFTVIEEGTEPTGDGLYMIDSGIYRVTEGNAKQIA